MKLHLVRTETGDEGTFSIGTLYSEPVKQWDFIELPWRQNQTGISCVPAGTYNAKLVDSQHFQRKVYLFENVPGRSAVEMHPANWAGDVSLGYHSDLRGCCAPGRHRGAIPPPGQSKAQPCVLESKVALDELIALTDGEDIEVTFEWAEGSNPE